MTFPRLQHSSNHRSIRIGCECCTLLLSISELIINIRWAHSVEMWSEQSRNCKQVLGLKDVKSVARCPDASYLRAGVDTLIESSRSLPAAKELLSLTEALDQFEDLNDKIGAEIKSQVDLSSFWGAILLLITVCTYSRCSEDVC